MKYKLCFYQIRWKAQYWADPRLYEELRASIAGAFLSNSLMVVTNNLLVVQNPFLTEFCFIWFIWYGKLRMYKEKVFIKKLKPNWYPVKITQKYHLSMSPIGNLLKSRLQLRSYYWPNTSSFAVVQVANLWCPR